MKVFVNLLVYFFFNKLIRTEKVMHMGLSKAKESSKNVSGKVGMEHEDSSSTNDVIIKISENKKKKTNEKKMSNRKNKKMNLGSEQKSKPQLPPPQAVESTYQVPTSNILFKDLDTKKIQISEKDYNDLIESNKEMSKMMTELNKYNIRSSAILRKLQNLNNPKDDSKPRDLFNIKVIEVSDDVKSSK